MIELACPSIGLSLKDEPSVVTGEKNWPVTVTPATVTGDPGPNAMSPGKLLASGGPSPVSV